MVKEINKFRKEFMGEHYEPISKKNLKSLKINSRILEVKDDETIIGLAVVTQSDSLTRRSLVIEDIIVDKKYRGKGVGNTMIESIIKLAKGFRVDCIDVQTKKTNKPAQALYRKFGFKNRNQISYRLWLKK